MITKPTPAKPDAIEVWCTKYALTSGVFKTRGCVYDDHRTATRPAFTVYDSGGTTSSYMLHYSEWHVTEALAIARVKAMVAAKRKALTKQIDALNVIEAGIMAGKLPMVVEVGRSERAAEGERL